MARERGRRRTTSVFAETSTSTTLPSLDLTDLWLGAYPQSRWRPGWDQFTSEQRPLVPTNVAELSGGDPDSKRHRDLFQNEPVQSSQGGPLIALNHHHKESGILLLHRAVALEALHDSSESFPQPRCHPETRKKLLKNLYRWATNPDSVYSVRWLHGVAGAGKSALMQALCRQLQDAGRLGGSFFFKRGHTTRGNASTIFATLAYQLALRQPTLKTLISFNLESDPSVLGRAMDVQLRTLIIEPCRLLQGTPPPVLLIDGLDECEGHDMQREVLRLIGSTATEQRLALRILVASRPEPHIREIFEEQSFRRLADSINIEQSFEDIRIYLRCEFSRIHREHSRTMGKIPTPWPAPRILDRLVRNSSGYFIYAATIVKFVDDEYSRPSKQLDIIQNLAPRDSQSPFEALDQLYIQILLRVPSRHRPYLVDILCFILYYPADSIVVEDVEALLGQEPGDVALILRPLHSVLCLSGQIRVHHASFRDFLNDKERSTIFYAGSPQQRTKLGCLILKALAYVHEDPQKNRADLWFRWGLSEAGQWLGYITSLAPSVDFVPLVRLVNPDFIFFDQIHDADLENFLSWLKHIRPVPHNLVRVWEDYSLVHSFADLQREVPRMLLRERDRLAPKRTDAEILDPSLAIMSVLRARMNSKFEAVLGACRQLLSRSPLLVRITQAKRLLTCDGNLSVDLFLIRIVLDLSWDDIRGCICSLRPLVTKESDFFFIFFLPTLCRELDNLYPESIVSRDLARGLLRLMRRIEDGELPMIFWSEWLTDDHEWHCLEWGRHVRSSPQSNPELLRELDQFVPPWDVFSEGLEPVEFYDVVRWLKTSTDAHVDLIDRWRSHLTESMARAGANYSDDELEERWQARTAKEAYIQGPSRSFDREVIRCWEGCLREYMSTGGG
ncbi:hypothetical protein B0H14DRAFT_3651798 [Mycena olivaceomarginata]|nr:hypothetical protein B0H14DRAFT_3651798 [Mycena olivaceomarginata]